MRKWLVHSAVVFYSSGMMAHPTMCPRCESLMAVAFGLCFNRS